MLVKLLIAIAVLIIVVLGVASTRPADFRLSRSATMAASPQTIFAHVNDLRHWEAWSPWAKMDPNAKSTFEGPAAGVGAKMSWDGNMKVGKGSMTIIESKPNELIRLRLDFEKPMAGTNIAEFTFSPQGTQTAVNWSMTGKNNLMAKVINLFMDCEKMVGGQFEKGLADLKAIVEKISVSAK